MISDIEHRKDIVVVYFMLNVMEVTYLIFT